MGKKGSSGGVGNANKAAAKAAAAKAAAAAEDAFLEAALDEAEAEYSMADAFPAELQEGATVMIHGVKARPELNELRGTIKTLLFKRGLCVVKLLTTGEIVEVKPKYLTRGAAGNFSIEEILRDQPSHGVSDAAAKAKLHYRAAKSRDAQRPKKCEECNQGDIELKACGACHAAWFCGRECQRKGWKAHKKVCEDLKDMRMLVNQDNEPGSVLTGSQLTIIPRSSIALPPSLTGYSAEVLVLYPASVFEDPALPRLVRDQEAKNPAFKASLLTSIKYFFKKERTGVGNLTVEEIGDFCSDALFAFHQGFEGIREVLGPEVNDDSNGKWALRFLSSMDAPKGK